MHRLTTPSQPDDLLVVGQCSADMIEDEEEAPT
jgi:hypothetical protein